MKTNAPTSCKYCGGNLIINPRPDTPHTAEYRCEQCKKNNGWVGNSETQRSKATVEKSKTIHKNNGCNFCGRFPEELGINEVITIDHIHEIKDGGVDLPSNTQPLCTACHKLKNWAQLYLNKHQKK